MTLLLAYARERLTAGRLLPALLLILVAVLAGRGSTPGPLMAADAAVALALVVAFRIWDDLADRVRDRARHPDRITVRAETITPLWMAAVAIGGGALTSLGLAHGLASVACVAGYAAVLAGVYAVRGSRSAAGDRILLLKYGVFTLALIGFPSGFGSRALAAAAAAFAAACVYEWWHDAESPIFSFGGSR
jgi:4-hydroxybenzoate polyprenyltransferase